MSLLASLAPVSKLRQPSKYGVEVLGLLLAGSTQVEIDEQHQDEGEESQPANYDDTLNTSHDAIVVYVRLSR